MPSTITTSHQTHTTRRATALGSAARGATAVGARAGRHIGCSKKVEVLIRMIIADVSEE
jgi:hypothetical protein